MMRPVTVTVCSTDNNQCRLSQTSRSQTTSTSCFSRVLSMVGPPMAPLIALIALICIVRASCFRCSSISFGLASSSGVAPLVGGQQGGNLMRVRRRAVLGGALNLKSSFGTYITDLEQESMQKNSGLRTMYPMPEGEFDDGDIQVDDLHKIYYRIYNPNNTLATALFLHGGPGAACFPNHARFFDPLHYRVVLLDQRGCGKSSPRGATQGNNLTALVGDLEALRERLGLDKFDVVLGGSWGVTLAMAYAQRHPTAVGALVLRGVCLFREREIAWLFAPGGGASILNPRGYDSFASALTHEERARGLSGVLDAYARDLLGENATARDAAARRWSSWEWSMTAFAKQFSGGQGGAGLFEWDGRRWTVDGRDEEEVRKEFLQKLRRPFNASSNATSNATAAASLSNATSIQAVQNVANQTSSSGGSTGASGGTVPAQAMLTCHFSRNHLSDFELLSPEAIAAIRHIPCTAVQGAADLICPPGTAFDLHQAWPEMKLVLVNGAGHSMYDDGITSELIKATDAYRVRVTGDGK